MILVSLMLFHMFFVANPFPGIFRYKKRLIFRLLSHQNDQQFEQKYENKREKSGSKVENSLELMLSQCCESSLTCSSPPSCREKRGETRADREKSLQK